MKKNKLHFRKNILTPLLLALPLLVFVSLLQSCAEDMGLNKAEAVGGGKGGSMARFAISGNTLYTVSTTQLKSFDISTPNTPVFEKETDIGSAIETIFPYKDKLFIGSQFGVYIYTINDGGMIDYLTIFPHAYACDPVVADDNYAYVTLSTIGECGRMINELQVIDIQDIANSQLLVTYPMMQPRGLGIDGNKLFVCDNGLQLMDASDPLNITTIKTFAIQAFDVIPYYGKLIVIGSDGLYQYSYTDSTINLLSYISAFSSL